MVYSFSRLEEILDSRTTCLLGLCIGNSTMGCLHDLYTWVKKAKQSCVSRHNQVLGNRASDLFVPWCVYWMYMSRWTFAFPFCDLRQISRLVSVEGKEIAKNCCYTITVDTRREGPQMRGFVGFCTSRSWSVCGRDTKSDSIMSDKKAPRESATGMDTCTCQRGKFTKSLMLYRGIFSFRSNGSLDWPELQHLRNSCPRAESRARRFQGVETNKSTSTCLQVKPQYLAYKEQGHYFMRRYAKH